MKIKYHKFACYISLIIISAPILYMAWLHIFVGTYRVGGWDSFMASMVIPSYLIFLILGGYTFYIGINKYKLFIFFCFLALTFLMYMVFQAGLIIF